MGEEYENVIVYCNKIFPMTSNASQQKIKSLYQLKFIDSRKHWYFACEAGVKRGKNYANGFQLL